MALSSLVTGKTEFDDQALCQYALEAKTNAVDTIFTKRNRMYRAWDEYNGNVDLGDKQPWQSTNHLPKFAQAVRMTKNLMKQNIIKANEFFVFKGENDKTKAVEKDITKALKLVLSQSKFKEKHFGNGVFRGLLENLIIFKTWVEPLGPKDKKTHPQQTHKFPVSVVSALDLYIDPTGRRKFIIQKIRMDLSDYRDLCEQGIYDKDSLEFVIEDFKQSEEAYREAQMAGEEDAGQPSWRKEVELLEYWGDVDNEYGERIHENVTFTIVNEKFLARKPIQNPFKHGKAPFAFGPIFELDGSEYAEGFGDHVIPITDMLNDFWRMSMDALFASQMKAFEVDTDLIDDPTQLTSGIYPFKTITKSGGMPGQNAIRDFSLGNVHPQALQMTGAIDREVQNATGVNEFISGIVGSGDKTATEVKQKAGQSMGFMQAISEDIEDNVVSPLVEMLFDNVVQYNPEILGEKVNLLSKDDLEYNFEVKGLSKMMKQLEDFNSLFGWVGMMAKTPAGQKLNWDYIAKETARMRNFEPEKVLLDEQAAPTQGQPTDQQKAQEELAKRAQMQAMQGGKA